MCNDVYVCTNCRNVIQIKYLRVYMGSHPKGSLSQMKHPWYSATSFSRGMKGLNLIKNQYFLNVDRIHDSRVQFCDICHTCGTSVVYLLCMAVGEVWRISGPTAESLCCGIFQASPGYTWISVGLSPNECRKICFSFGEIYVLDCISMLSYWYSVGMSKYINTPMERQEQWHWWRRCRSLVLPSGSPTWQWTISHWYLMFKSNPWVSWHPLTQW